MLPRASSLVAAKRRLRNFLISTPPLLDSKEEKMERGNKIRSHLTLSNDLNEWGRSDRRIRSMRRCSTLCYLNIRRPTGKGAGPIQHSAGAVLRFLRGNRVHPSLPTMRPIEPSKGSRPGNNIVRGEGAQGRAGPAVFFFFLFLRSIYKREEIPRLDRVIFEEKIPVAAC